MVEGGKGKRATDRRKTGSTNKVKTRMEDEGEKFRPEGKRHGAKPTTQPKKKKE